jgi:hypothetical protein
MNDYRWCPTAMSVEILRAIVAKYEFGFEKDVVEAACAIMEGVGYDGWPPWLSLVVCNHATAVGICLLDELSRDINHTLHPTKFEHERLILNCRVVGDELGWKMSEIWSIEYVFFTRNDMHLKVYYHKVVQAIECMMSDLFDKISEGLGLVDAMRDVTEFVKWDDRLLYRVELGQYGDEAREIALAIKERRLYRFIGEIHLDSQKDAGEVLSQRSAPLLAQDFCDVGEFRDLAALRVLKVTQNYGIGPTKHPLLSVPFWRSGEPNTLFRLTEGDLSCISPGSFAETIIRVFVTDRKSVPDAKIAFEKWKGTVAPPK